MSAFSKKQLRSRQSAPGPGQDTHCLALGFGSWRFLPAQIDDAMRGKSVSGINPVEQSADGGEQSGIVPHAGPPEFNKFKGLLNFWILARPGLSGILCGGPVSSVEEPLAKDDSELCLCLDPFPRRPFPLLGRVVKNEI